MNPSTFDAPATDALSVSEHAGVRYLEARCLRFRVRISWAFLAVGCSESSLCFSGFLTAEHSRSAIFWTRLYSVCLAFRVVDSAGLRIRRPPYLAACDCCHCKRSIIAAAAPICFPLAQ